MKRLLIFIALSVIAATLAAAPIPCVEQTKQDGLHTSGDTVTFRIFAQDKETKKILPGVNLEYRLTVDGEKPRSGKIPSEKRDPDPFSAASLKSKLCGQIPQLT